MNCFTLPLTGLSIIRLTYCITLDAEDYEEQGWKGRFE